MKLHLPHRLFAWLTALAALGMTVPGLNAADTDVISINFIGAKEGAQGTSISSDATVGLVGVAGSSWTQVSETSGSVTIGDSVNAAWSSANLWLGGTPSSEASKLLYGYLDDGGTSGASINVSGLTFLTYDLYIYCNTDTSNANFTAKTVNGVSYTYDTTTSSTVTGSGSWGSNSSIETLEEGVNALHITGLTASTLAIAGGSKSGTTTRGCISGIQIVNTYAGTGVGATLSGTQDWTDAAIGSAAWTDSTAEAGTFAAITVSGDTPAQLNIASGEMRTTDAVVLSGGDLTISGGTLNLINAGTLRTDSDHTLTVESDVSGKLFVEGNVSILGDATLDSLTGSGSLSFGENSTVSVASADSAFTGALTIAASQYDANESWARTASSLTLLGEGSATVTLESGTLGSITHANSTLNITKIGSGTATINGTHATDISALDIQAGTVELPATNDGTVYSFDSVTIGENATLKLTSCGSVLRNANNTATPVTMKGGASLIMDNCKAGGAETIVKTDITVDAAGSFVKIAGSLYGNGLKLAGTISGSGELRFTNGSGANNFSVTANISGGLSVKLDKGSSTLYLSGNNTYTGTTNVASGNLVIQNDTALGSGNVTIGNSGVLTLQAGQTFTMEAGAGTINAGAHTHVITMRGGTHSTAWTGTGSISLKGDNGNVTLSANANTTFTGSLSIDLSQNVILSGGQVFNSSVNVSLTGHSDKWLILDSQYGSVANALNIGSLTGDSAAEIRGDWNTSDTTKHRYIAVHQDSDTEFAGKVIKAGNDTKVSVGLVKNGTGALTLSGANTSEADLIVKDGAVKVSGSEARWSGNVVVGETPAAEEGEAGAATAAPKLVLDGKVGVDTDNTAGVTVYSGTLETGSSAEVLGSGNVTIGSAGTLMIGSDATGTRNSLSVGGTLSLADGATVDLSLLTLTENEVVLATAGIIDLGNVTLTGLTLQEGYTATLTAVATPTFTTAQAQALVLTIAQAPDELTATSVVSYTGGMMTLNVDGTLAGKTGDFDVTVSGDLWNAMLAQVGGNADTTFNVTLVGTDGENFTLTNDATVTLNGYAGTAGAAGNREYTLAYIPEPTTGTLSVLALAALALRRRRK